MPEEKETVWSEGMECPHCGGTELVGDNCAFCGARLVTEPAERFAGGRKVGDVPLGTYKGAMGCFLRLDADVLIIRNCDKEETIIRYQDVTDVGFRGPKGLCFGWLAIRNKDNAFLPLPTKYTRVLHDKTTVLYQNQDTELFRTIFSDLRMMAQRNMFAG